MPSASTAATVEELLQRAQAALHETSQPLDPILQLCKERVDECLRALQGATPLSTAASEIPDLAASSSTQSTQTVNAVLADAVSQASAVLADAVSQANPPSVEMGSQVPCRLHAYARQLHIALTRIDHCMRRRQLCRRTRVHRRRRPEHSVVGTLR